jgi:acetate kinase
VQHILTLNAGSSSIKFALFDCGSALEERLRGEIEGLGSTPHLQAEKAGETIADRLLDAGTVIDHASALAAVLGLLEHQIGEMAIAAVGHRIVHGGMTFSEPVAIDEPRFLELQQLAPLAPLHQPHNLAPIRSVLAANPDLPQVACFDTAFHRSAPEIAQAFALPFALHDEGIRRYGFHGLSYEYIASVLPQRTPEIAGGRVVVAHLGNGA